jgi:uncharacterized membrane protein YccC
MELVPQIEGDALAELVAKVRKRKHWTSVKGASMYDSAARALQMLGGEKYIIACALSRDPEARAFAWDCFKRLIPTGTAMAGQITADGGVSFQMITSQVQPDLFAERVDPVPELMREALDQLGGDHAA